MGEKARYVLCRGVVNSGCIFNRERLGYEHAGVVNKVGNMFTLSKQYVQPTSFITYYGMLQYSGIDDYSIYKLIIAADQTATEVAKVMADGCKVFQYVPFGSRFNDGEFLTKLKETISQIASAGIADGIFLDECEVGYWDFSYYDNPEKCEIFREGLLEATSYCSSVGLESIVNGTAAYGDIGTYYMWESFVGTWNTNKICWQSDGDGRRIVNSDGTINYYYPWSEWTLTGSLRISDDGFIVDGTEGTMSIEYNINDKTHEPYQDFTDFVYYEWFGEGADDESLQVFAFIGNSLPYDSETWEELPQLWKGEPGSWDGINKQAQCIRIELRFKGATNLRMDSCFVAYGYVYPTYDMALPNPPADDNPELWNYNLSKWEYLRSVNSRDLCHSYGTITDETKMAYTFTCYKVLDGYAWDYTHPLHQTIRYTDVLDDPFGCMLKSYQTSPGFFHGDFSGLSCDVDMRKARYSLHRFAAPNYWFDRGIDSFSQEELVYANPSDYSSHVFTTDVVLDEEEEIPDGEILAIYGPYYQYDYEWNPDGSIKKQTIKRVDEYTGEEIKYTKTVVYKKKMPAECNVREVYCYDDIFYFYFAIKVQGEINLFLDEDKLNRYYIYLCAEGIDYGFAGEWFSLPYKAQFMIYNQSLFKWNKDAEDESDYTQFHYIGNTFLEYEFQNADRSFIRYRIKKSVLGECSRLNMHFLIVTETPDNLVNIYPENYDTSVDPVYIGSMIDYTQRRYDLYSPHGYVRSDECDLGGYGFVISYEKNEPENTEVKFFVRWKVGGEWKDYTEVKGPSMGVLQICEKVQWVISLNTLDGKVSPMAGNVRVIKVKVLPAESEYIHNIRDRISMRYCTTQFIEYKTEFDKDEKVIYEHYIESDNSMVTGYEFIDYSEMEVKSNGNMED